MKRELTEASATRWHVILTLVSIVWTAVLALRLSSEYFQSTLNSDHLYPHVFVKDFWSGVYSISGWNFGSATFLFPDYPVYSLIWGLVGDGGLSFPLFAALNFIALGLAIGFFLKRLGVAGSGWKASAWGLSLVGGLLCLQFFGQHGYSLYFIALPGFHGGTLINGFLILGLIAPATLKSQPLTRIEAFIALGLSTMGLFSNTLLFVQFTVPWLAMLFLRDRHLQSVFLFAFLLPLLGVLGARLLLSQAGIWGHAKVFRHFPFPDQVLETVLVFLQQFPGETFQKMWIFWLLAIPLIPVGLFALYKLLSRRSFSLTTWFAGFALISVGLSVALPVVALYWKDFTNTRYFLNLLVFPAVLLAIWALQWPANRLKRSRDLFLKVVPVPMVIMILPVVIELTAHPERLSFPYPPEVAEFDEMVRELDLHAGLGGYWQGHFYNELNRSGVRLNNITESGTPYLWCNNTYWYDGSESARNEDFLLVNDLDPEALLELYGPPDERHAGTYNTFWIYRDPDRLSPVLHQLIQTSSAYEN